MNFCEPLTWLPLWISELNNTDIIAASSVFIALLAFAVAVGDSFAKRTEAAAQRAHNKLAVRPHIEWKKNIFPSKPLTLSITNAGLGPAIIEECIIRFRSIPYPHIKADLPDAIKQNFIDLGLVYETVLIDKNTAMKEGTEIQILSMEALWYTNDGRNTYCDQDLYADAVDLMNNFEFKILYKSFYGETFETTSPNTDIHCSINENAGPSILKPLSISTNR